MVNIDTVYQRVLAISNKEQRGYITPLEFNLLANQAQMAIFESYFYDRNKLSDAPGNSSEFSDADSMIDEKISMFQENGFQVATTGILPAQLYRLGAVYFQENANTWFQHAGGNTDIKRYEAKQVSGKNWITIQNSPLLQPTNKRPIYIRAANRIQVFGSHNRPLGVDPNTALSRIFCDYIFQPKKVEWGYDVIGEKALYNGNPNKTTHFSHHPSDETELVMKILELAGVIIEDPGIIQYANQTQKNTQQQQKS